MSTQTEKINQSSGNLDRAQGIVQAPVDGERKEPEKPQVLLPSLLDIKEDEPRVVVQREVIVTDVAPKKDVPRQRKNNALVTAAVREELQKAMGEADAYKELLQDVKNADQERQVPECKAPEFYFSECTLVNKYIQLGKTAAIAFLGGVVGASFFQFMPGQAGFEEYSHCCRWCCWHVCSLH